MDTRVDKVVLPSSGYASNSKYYKEDRNQAVVDFVNALVNEGYWNFEELPDAARTIYFADYLNTEVCNGGLGQFFLNTGGRFNSMVVASLEALGTSVHLDVFRSAVELFDPSESRHTDEMNSGYEELNDRFLRLHEEQTLTDVCYKYLESLGSSLDLVSDEEYGKFIQRMTVDHPEYSARYERVKPELEQLEADANFWKLWEDAAESICSDANLDYGGVSAYGPTEVNGATYDVMFFAGFSRDSEETFSYGMYLEPDTNQMVIVDGETFEELGRI